MKKIITIILCLFCGNSYASLIVTPTSWSNGDTVTAAKLNGNQNAITTVVNGSLDNTNMSSGYKLFQVVSSLPSPGNQGAVAFLTSNNTLNLDSGSAWLSTVTPSGTLATGKIPYYNGGWQLLSPGAQYLPLVSNGISSLPTYQTLSAHAGGTNSDLSASVQGTIPYFSSTGTMSVLGTGTSGQFLKTQGASANPIWASVNWVPTNIQVFSASGTWTKPAGVSQVYVKIWGSGGGGSGGNGTTNGNGGGSGGYSEGTTSVSGNVTVTIGSGGTAGLSGNNAGGNGGNSSFAGVTTLTANGGSGGSAPTTPSGGGAGGSASNGSINITGWTGRPTTLGYGADSLMGIGQGGQVGASATNGTNGGFAAGGGGGFGSGGGTDGGTGGDGYCIVYY